MQEFIIQKNDAGQRLDKFLQKALPHLPVSMLYKALRTKNIKCNKKRAEGAQRLQCGDVIACYLPQDCFAPAAYAYDFLRASGTLDVLFEDAHVLLLDKPAGLLSHSNPDAYCDTLLGRVQRYLFEKGEYDPAGELS
ncbi:MAG: RluA family pseudouridine synthase, partial [Oscillospiraceae bacterium]|nr:RluA family pseudouridine synthase [Oscillospiraceae bacterium]